MEKRFQVFVSSTFRDLEDERKEVIHALLELDCIPAGMELFPAASDTQWNLIKRVIEDCDYYILILAGRYGSIGPEGLSYTEMEYQYAIEIGKPTVAFLHRDPGKIILDKTEKSPDGKEKLLAFRSLVEKKLCKHWATPQELGSVVSRSLIQLTKTAPAIGWVRANELATHEATMELLQLRKRVEELQSELNRARVSAPKGSEGLAQEDEQHTLNFTFVAYLNPNKTWEPKRFSANFVTTWNTIFSSIAPLMIHESDDEAIKRTLDSFVEYQNRVRLQKHPEMATATQITGFSLLQEDFQTIKVQLRALGLVAKSEKPRSVKDSGTYWTLTAYGDELMTRLRAIRRRKEDGVADESVTPVSESSDPF